MTPHRPAAAARRGLALVLTACLTAALVPPLHAGTVPEGFADEVWAPGRMDSPSAMTFVPGDLRLLVTELFTGRVHLLLADGTRSPIDPLFTVDSVASGPERGLLGIAVDPYWPARPYVYVQYTHLSSTIRVSRYRVEGDLVGDQDGVLTVDPASRYDVLAGLPDDDPSHNGGTLRFAPDGTLYSSLGDDDGYCVARDLHELRGKILRLTLDKLPDGPGGPPAREALVPYDNPFALDADVSTRLIWAYGFRNPFRFTIDSRSGDLFVGDVGQNTWEEIDHVDGGGLDFGWPSFEGPVPFDVCEGIAKPPVAPLYSYDRTSFSCAVVVAGPVYQRKRQSGGFPADYQGDFFFNDACDGFLRRLSKEKDGWVLAPPVPGQPDPENWGTGFWSVVDWALGPDGAMYYCTLTEWNPIHRIRTTAPRPAERAPEPDLSLEAPYPSPGRGTIHFELALEHPGAASLEVYDVHGRRVRALSGPLFEVGPHAFGWDGLDDRGRPAAAGVYFARLTQGAARIERRFVLLR